MSPITEGVFQTARALPTAEQVELIDALIACLDEASPQPLDSSWVEEIQKRSAAFDRGEVTAIPWAEVQARLRAGRTAGG